MRRRPKVMPERDLRLFGRCLRGPRQRRPGQAAPARAVLPALLLLLLGTGCESAAPVVPEAPSGHSEGSGYSRFSGDTAWGHLEALAGIGPRVSGSEGSHRAQAYLRAELEAMGAQVATYRFEVQPATPSMPARLAKSADSASPADSAASTASTDSADFGDLAVGLDSPPVPLVSLVGVLPGDSEDIFLIAAPYDTAEFHNFRFVGANGGASGPALVLEVGRVLASRPRPYTIWLAFVDGDAFSASGGDVTHFLGSELLSQQWQESGVLERVRFAVFVDRVADADLTIARDLWSHGMYRDLFWQAARNLGYAEEFAPDRGFESPATGHRAFLDRRLRRVVALVDNRYGAGEPPGSYWRSEEDTLLRCSPESLTTVGQVTLEALFHIGQRLEKIDRFSRSPF